MAQQRILVVDDEQKIVDVIKSYLEKSGYGVVCAATGGQALELFDRAAPSLVVLDLMLPDITGEEICRAIRQKSSVPVIMLTAKAGEESLLQGLKIGADDYITKPFSPRVLVARVEAVLRRATGEAEAGVGFAFDNGELAIDSLRHEVRKNGEAANLTPNEYKILLTMAKRPNRVFTREELISFALGEGFEGYDRVIDTHIKNIRQKIEPDAKQPRYVITVHGVGYRFGGSGNAV